MGVHAATLGSARVNDGWRWELPAQGPIPLADGPLESLRALAKVDVVTDASVTNFSVESRYRAVETMLDHVWNCVVRPFLDQVGTLGLLELSVPGSMLRLPITTARSAETGESLVHFAEPILRWGSGPSPPIGTPVVRVDGHLREVAGMVSSLRVDPGTTLLLMGCRTAELIPLLPPTGASAAIVTSWDVEDRHCARVGDLLEERIRSGLSPSAALRSVQALASSQHPYEWAGYSVVELCAGVR